MKYIEKQKEVLLDMLSKLYLTHYWSVIISGKFEYVWANKEVEEQANTIIEIINHLNEQQYN